MHTLSTGQLALPSSSRALRDLLLGALDAPQPRPLGGNTGLPEGAVDLIDRKTVVVVSQLTEHLFDSALVRYAAASSRDVVLVRSGMHPETLDPVRVDVALRSSCGGPILVPDLSLWRGRTARSTSCPIATICSSRSQAMGSTCCWSRRGTPSTSATTD